MIVFNKSRYAIRDRLANTPGDATLTVWPSVARCYLGLFERNHGEQSFYPHSLIMLILLP
jgi:hypothetical protein